jgi:hypothetical protein
MSEHRESQRSGGVSAEGEPPVEPGIGSIEPDEIVRAASELARESPHAALAGAFAVGFLLGGGLTPRLLASLAMILGRRYAAEVAREALGGVVQRQIEEMSAQ